MREALKQHTCPSFLTTNSRSNPTWAMIDGCLIMHRRCSASTRDERSSKSAQRVLRRSVIKFARSGTLARGQGELARRAAGRKTRVTSPGQCQPAAPPCRLFGPAPLHDSGLVQLPVPLWDRLAPRPQAPRAARGGLVREVVLEVVIGPRQRPLGALPRHRGGRAHVAVQAPAPARLRVRRQRILAEGPRAARLLLLVRGLRCEQAQLPAPGHPCRGPGDVVVVPLEGPLRIRLHDLGVQAPGPGSRHDRDGVAVLLEGRQKMRVRRLLVEVLGPRSRATPCDSIVLGFSQRLACDVDRSCI
mmetsp:Transcript_81183/g.219956  ORF Transcript_81183/g.219956 Transcript_81183/m.219956 type:complete len:302 (-) Transcript_81183:989-1894(-)